MAEKPTVEPPRLSLEDIETVLEAAHELAMLYGPYPKGAEGARFISAHLGLTERHDDPQQAQRNWPKGK